MIGQIESYDAETQTGFIKSGEEQFEFNHEQWASPADPETGDDVTFEVVDGKVVSADLVGAYLQPQPVKSRVLAAILALLLGWAGIHRLYLGYYRIALLQIAVTALTVGYGAVWGFIEFVLLLNRSIAVDGKGRPLK